MVPPRGPIMDFGDLTRALEGTYSRDDFIRIFARFQDMRDNESRLRFIIDNPVFSSFEINPKKERKCPKESDRMRREANGAFSGRCFDAALICYGRSVILAEKPVFEGRKEEDPSTQLALAYFNRANNLYQMRRYTCAIKDIRRAKQNGFTAKELFKLYALESKCWEKMQYYEKALEAFGMACKLEPPHPQEELMTRSQQVAKRFAYLNQKAFKNGGEGFKLSEEEEEKILSGPSRVYHKVLPRFKEPTLGDKNERLPNASAKLELKFHQDKGRYFAANRDIEPGEVLIQEPPFAQVLMPQHWPTHCFHCLHYTDVPVPCKNCATIVFCSEACRDAAALYHEFECEFLVNLREQTVVNLTLLAARMVFTAGLEGIQVANFEMEALDLKDRDQLLSTPREKCDPKDYLNICTMVTHCDKWEPMTHFQLGLLAAYVVFLMEKTGFFDDKSKEERELALKEQQAEADLKSKKEAIFAKMMQDASGMAPPKKAVMQKNFSASAGGSPNVKAYFEAMPTKKQELVLLVGSYLMRHMMGLRSNRFAISETLVRCPSTNNGSGDATRATEDPVVRYNSIGRAVGATMMLLSHSCCPNTSWELVDGQFVARALKPIKTGQEVTCSYGFKFQTDAAEERQKVLKRDFLFDCTCHACVENWPLAKDSVGQKPYFQCPDCKATMEYMTTCPQCGRECKDEFIRLAISSPEFQKARKDLDNLDIAKAEPVITEHIKACDGILHEANIEYVMAVECLKQVFILQGLVTTKVNN